MPTSISTSATITDSHVSPSQTDITPQQFLQLFPDSAYTTMYVQGGEVYDLELHLQRLSRNVDTLAGAGRFKNLQESARAARAIIEGQLSQLVSQMPIQELDTGVLVVVATDTLPEESYLRQQSTDDTARTSNPGGNSLRLAAYLKSSSTADTRSPVKAVVVGPPRQQADVKDTNWVTVRRPLAQKVPEDAAEGLLQDGRGRLLEGLVSNLLVVREPLPGELGEKVLETAPAGTVLAGTIRKRVLHIAEDQGYVVSETSPDPRQRHLWQEAYVCNALRIMQPLSLIECPEGTAPADLGAWTVELPQQDSPDTQRLRDALLSAMDRVPLSSIAAGSHTAL